MFKETIILVVGLALLLFTGCEESQQNGSKVWGNGELPAGYVQMFGNDNSDRLNFVQNEAINRHNAIIGGIDVTDDQGETVHKRGLIERITHLEAKVAALTSGPEQKLPMGTLNPHINLHPVDEKPEVQNE